MEGNIQCKLGCQTHWVSTGDFNMSKDVDQTNSVGNKFMRQREVAIQLHMTISLGLQDAWLLDSFKTMSKKSFTYDNGWEGANATLTRLNKFYTYQLCKLGGRIGVLVSLNKIFDHSLITLWIKPTHGGTDLGPQMFDLTFLEDECRKAKLMATQKGNGERPTTTTHWAWWLERPIGRVMCYSYELSKQRCKKRKEAN